MTTNQNLRSTTAQNTFTQNFQRRDDRERGQ